MKPLTDEQIREAYPRDSYSLMRAGTGRIITHSTNRYKNHTDTLADVLCDLIHYAATEGIDFDEALGAAKHTWWRNTGIIYE